MYYIIRVAINGGVRYIYNKNLVVSDIDCARKFYSSSYARRYVRTHERYKDCEFEVIRRS